jgi:putative acetyltransferase
MVRGTQFSREMRRGEEPAVAAVLERAFGGQAEARLVVTLRRAGDFVGVSVVASGDGLVGALTISKMSSA